jgi:hypothetical protein
MNLALEEWRRNYLHTKNIIPSMLPLLYVWLSLQFIMSYVNDFQITFVVARHISDLTGNPVCIYFLALPVIFMVIRYIFYFSMQIIPSSFFQCQIHMVSLCLMDYEQFSIAILLILTIHRDLNIKCEERLVNLVPKHKMRGEAHEPSAKT